MALINTSVTTASSKKQIAVKAALNTVLYTVPVGKTFTGLIIAHSNIDVLINGVTLPTLTSINSSTNASYPPFPVTLVEGTVVSCGGSYNNWSILGVEE